MDPEAFRGWLDVFRGNPLFMAGHIYVAPDGKPTSIGTWPQIDITSDSLEGVAKFMDEGDALADAYWTRYRQGIQKAVSVGFLTHAWEMRDMDINGARQRVRVFTEVELVEVSAVSIPANRQSLVRAASAFGRAGVDPAMLAEPLRQAGAMGGVPGGVTREEVESIIARSLDTRPGGPIHMLAIEVAEQVLALSSHGIDDPYDDLTDDARGSGDDAPGDDPSGGGGGGDDEEIKAMLREAVEAFG